MHDTPLRASAARTRTAANHSLPSSKNRTCTSSTVAYAMVKPPFLSLPPFSIWHLPPILCSSPSCDPSPHCCYTLIITRCWVGLRVSKKSSLCHPFFFRPTSGRASHPHCHHPSSPLIAWISKLSNPCLSRCAPRGWQTGTTNSSSIQITLSILLLHCQRSNHSLNHCRSAFTMQQQHVPLVCPPNGVSSIIGGRQLQVCEQRWPTTTAATAATARTRPTRLAAMSTMRAGVHGERSEHRLSRKHGQTCAAKSATPNTAN